jgi:hypothetical protein
METDTKERLFEAWSEWDLEIDDPTKKEAARDRLNDLIDLYRQETGITAARFLVRFYLRDEYADWRIKNA